ncbi:MAG: sigma-54-dependent transcriptional regulator [Myxococcota bacterium]
MTRSILVVDDDAAMCDLLESGLRRHGYEVTSALRAEDAKNAVVAKEFDIAVIDLRLGGDDGLRVCEFIAENRPQTPVIVITAFGSLDSAVAAIRVGAYDFIMKPISVDGLLLTLDRALSHRDLREEVKRLRQDAAPLAPRDGAMIGDSRALERILDLIDRVSDSEASVLITGESGTGKELVARAIHDRSGRKGPFVAVNCAAMPATLLESELFGHVKGAFTDARESRDGLFIAANSGTLFLDEIGEMPMEMQPKLLRALQERKVRPVGGTTEKSFDTRIITATNRDLELEVEDNRFREDLFYRVNVVTIPVPPLRARGNDVLTLAQAFVQTVARRTGKPVKGLSSAAAQKLLDYDWPGNVRELQNCIERAVTLTRFEEITVDDLPEKVRRYESSHVVVAGDDPAELITLHELERRYIHRVLKAAGGNKTQAARVLGLDRRTLYRKLERYQERSAQAEA